MCPLTYLRDVAAPALQEGAQAAGRPKPPLIAHIHVAVCEQAQAVRDSIRPMIAFYPTLPFYARMLQDAGFPEIKEGKVSDETIDSFVIHGSAGQVKSRLRELPDYGIDEILVSVVEPASDPQTYERTVRVLGELARE
jgi:alkanesulfonate monooxygenase SsuD/methylene tetrahydromethanopterin reductase-like flavin-dependent oxidoreductase (luciferase family)